MLLNVDEPWLPYISYADCIQIVTSNVISQAIKQNNHKDLLNTGTALLPLSLNNSVNTNHIVNIVNHFIIEKPQSNNNNNNNNDEFEVFINNMWKYIQQGDLKLESSTLSDWLCKSAMIRQLALQSILHAEDEITCYQQIEITCSQHSQAFQTVTQQLHEYFIQSRCCTKVASRIDSFIQNILHRNESDFIDLYPEVCQPIVTLFIMGDESLRIRDVQKIIQQIVTLLEDVSSTIPEEKWNQQISPIFTHFPNWYLKIIKFVCTTGKGGKFGEIVRENCRTLCDSRYEGIEVLNRVVIGDLVKYDD